MPVVVERERERSPEERQDSREHDEATKPGHDGPMLAGCEKRARHSPGDASHLNRSPGGSLFVALRSK